MLKPVLKQFDIHSDSSAWGSRVSLSMDGCHTWALSMTEKGVRLLSLPDGGFFSVLTDSCRPRVYRGSIEDFPTYPIVSSVTHKGIKIDLMFNGKKAVIAADSSEFDENWLLMLTPDGIFRYQFISIAMLHCLGWPYDSERRLQILRG